MTETEVRAIVQDELQRALPAPSVDPVVEFLRRCPPGEVTATELFEAFGRFLPGHGLTPRAFAFRALRSGLVTRRTTRLGRLYTVPARLAPTSPQAA